MKVRITLQWTTCTLPKIYGDVSKIVDKREFGASPLNYWEAALLRKAADKLVFGDNIKVKRICVTYLESRPISVNSPNYKPVNQ